MAIGNRTQSVARRMLSDLVDRMLRVKSHGGLEVPPREIAKELHRQLELVQRFIGDDDSDDEEEDDESDATPESR